MPLTGPARSFGPAQSSSRGSSSSSSSSCCPRIDEQRTNESGGRGSGENQQMGNPMLSRKQVDGLKQDQWLTSSIQQDLGGALSSRSRCNDFVL
ncbi:unnamed protein product, partial [Polarella glacialis]